MRAVRDALRQAGHPNGHRLGHLRYGRGHLLLGRLLLLLCAAPRGGGGGGVACGGEVAARRRARVGLDAMLRAICRHM